MKFTLLAMYEIPIQKFLDLRLFPEISLLQNTLTTLAMFQILFAKIPNGWYSLVCGIDNGSFTRK